MLKPYVVLDCTYGVAALSMTEHRAEARTIYRARRLIALHEIYLCRKARLCDAVYDHWRNRLVSVRNMGRQAGLI